MTVADRPLVSRAERPGILPMRVDVESIVATLILRSTATHRATKRAIVLGHFAPEDREKVAAVVDRKLDEAEARRLGRVKA